MESVRLTGDLGDWETIAIRFSGDVVPRGRATPFKGAMFAAYAGDLIFSKIDARNGALGLVSDTIPKAVVTSEYPVLIPDLGRLRPAYLGLLLGAEHFQAELQRQASGTSGRKRVPVAGLLGLRIPLPSLAEQDALVAAHRSTLGQAERLEREAEKVEAEGRATFEDALRMTPPPQLPERPVFIARFRHLERWSHEGVLRTSLPPRASDDMATPLTRLGDVIGDLENGWSPKCLDRPAAPGKWGVLKVGAVSFGTFDASQNKELPDQLQPIQRYHVGTGDVRISRANVVRYVGACAFVEDTPPRLMLCDKIFRVRF